MLRRIRPIKLPNNCYNVNLMSRRFDRIRTYTERPSLSESIFKTFLGFATIFTGFMTVFSPSIFYDILTRKPIYGRPIDVNKQILQCIFITACVLFFFTICCIYVA